jgi:3',5'-cyclic AMP phosphodiesterase CpdA
LAQIIHISDLHLVPRGSWRNYFAKFAQNLRLGSYLASLYSVALPSIKARLVSRLPRLANGEPTALVLTGDIGVWPDVQASIIDAEFYDYVKSLILSLPVGSELVPLLGNHDWGSDTAGQRRTHFSGTQFDADYDTQRERYEIFDKSDPWILFFILDSSNTVTPTTGEVKPSGFQLLTDGFNAGRNSRLQPLTSDEYNRAFKVVLLHHSPVRQLVYDGLLSPWWYSRLELKNRDRLLDVCRNDVDMFLFGHTHAPMPIADDGYIMLDGGSALALPPVGSVPYSTIQAIRFTDRNLVTVETYSFDWGAGDFLPTGSRSFRRGAARSNARAAAKWG